MSPVSRSRAGVAACEAGGSITVIADRFGLSSSRAGTIIRADGGLAPVSGPGFGLDVDFCPFREVHEAGSSVRELAAKAGSPGAMQRGLAVAGAAFRRRGPQPPR